MSGLAPETSCTSRITLYHFIVVVSLCSSLPSQEIPNSFPQIPDKFNVGAIREPSLPNVSSCLGFWISSFVSFKANNGIT